MPGCRPTDYVYEADELVTGQNTIFVATGVTDGQLVAGVRREGDYVYTRERRAARALREPCAASPRSTSPRSGSERASDSVGPSDRVAAC